MVLIFLLFAMAAVSPEEEYKITCKVVCKQDGDLKFWIDEDGCNCGNPRNVGHVPTKIKRIYKQDVTIEKKSPWGE